MKWQRKVAPTACLIMALSLVACGPALSEMGKGLSGAAVGVTPTAEMTIQGGPTAQVVDSTTLIAVNGTDSPMLKALAGDYTVVASSDLALPALSAAATDRSGVEAIQGAAAVVADLSTLSPEAISGNAIFKAAHEAGVPIILENADAERMAAVTGFGFDASAVVLQPAADGQEVTVTVLGESGESALEESAIENAQVKADKKGNKADETLSVQASAPEALSLASEPAAEEAVSADAGSLAGAVKALLDEAPTSHSGRVAGQGAALQTIPYTAKRVWNVSLPLRYWSPGYTQRAYSSLNFRVELYDTVAPDNKWVMISSDSLISSPGSLTWNLYEGRGYYQEKMEVEFGPSMTPAGMTLQRHAPATAAGVTSVQTTTGFQVGMGDSGPQASWGTAQMTPMNLQSFKMTNESTGLRSRWTASIASVNQVTPYTGPLSLVCKSNCEQAIPGLYALPSLALTEMQARNQAVWSVPGNYQTSVPFRFWYRQTLREVLRTSAAGGTYTFTERGRSYSRWLEPAYINFSAVNY